MTRLRAHHWTAVCLGAAAALLLSLAAAILLQSHNSQMKEMREQAAQTRARLMAQSIGQSLAHAISIGIPLHQLVEVQEFLERWRKNHPEVTHIAVHDQQGRVLWRSRSAIGLDNVPVTTGRAELISNDMVHARVSLQMQSNSLEDPGKTWALLGSAILLVSALAYLAAYFSCAQGPWLRNHGFKIISDWAIQGDYLRLLVLPQRKRFDLRVQEVAHAIRRVHEQMARMRRLIGSLRRTEPQQLRRDYLDQILKKTIGSDHFTDDEPEIVRLVAAQSQSLWMALLLCLGAVSPLTFALLTFQTSTSTADRWSPNLPTLSLVLLVLAAAAGWRLFTHLRISALSVLLLSNTALLLPPLGLLLGKEIHPGLIAAWNGFFSGAAMAACTRAQTHPDQHLGFAHSRPFIPGAALLAWWSCLLWLAPALGYYAYETLPNTWAELALLLPCTCVLFFATRWDVAHSPWRVRMEPPPSSRWPDHQLLALGIAAGLIAGKMLNDILSFDSSALPQQCALGIGLGLGIVWPRWRPEQLAREPLASQCWQAIAVAAVMLQLAITVSLPAGLLWPVQLMSHLLLGLLLGYGFAQLVSRPQDGTAQQLLLCSALGAALCTAAIMLGLQAWPNVLAVVLLLTQISAHLRARTKVPHAH